VAGGTTFHGLPRRRPGAQLVPGGVRHPATTATPTPRGDWRDPAAVSASLAAYSRGLAAGRAHAAASALAPTEWSRP
jgi:hypothetical protein